MTIEPSLNSNNAADIPALPDNPLLRIPERPRLDFYK
jgi:hypothetical protein